MRLRKVKNADEIISKSTYVIKDKEQYCGKYQDLFLNKNPLFLEIGMGKGTFLIENAKKYPDRNFIGIEKFSSVLVRAVQKVEEYQLENIKFIQMDAEDIEDVFDHEIETLFLNFSDPWPKARHEHRRLTSPLFLKRYQKIFKNENHILMKTDNRKLFEYSIQSFVQNRFLIDHISLDLHKDALENIETEYEKKFKELGVIYQIEVTRQN